MHLYSSSAIISGIAVAKSALLAADLWRFKTKKKTKNKKTSVIAPTDLARGCRPRDIAINSLGRFLERLRSSRDIRAARTSHIRLACDRISPPPLARRQLRSRLAVSQNHPRIPDSRTRLNRDGDESRDRIPPFAIAASRVAIIDFDRWICGVNNDTHRGPLRASPFWLHCANRGIGLTCSASINNNNNNNNNNKIIIIIARSIRKMMPL